MHSANATTTTVKRGEVGGNTAAEKKALIGTGVPVYHMQREDGTSQYAIWDAGDAMQLRKSHHLMGDFVGTLPKHLSQNQFLTVPLLLTSEEVRRGLAAAVVHPVCDNPVDYTPPCDARARAFHAERDADVHRQVEEAVVRQREERVRRGGAEKSRKRKRVAEKDEPHATEPTPKAERCDGPTPATVPGTPDSASNDDERPQKVPRLSLFARFTLACRSFINAISPTARMQQQPDDSETNGRTLADEANHPPAVKDATDEQALLAQLAASEEQEAAAEDGTGEAWREQARQKVLDEKTRHQSRAASLIVTATMAREDEKSERKACPRWPQPIISARRALARQAVFDDLHARGYMMSCGAKFGTDFLAYAGDPQMFHAALAIVVTEGGDSVTARDVVALGRLGDSTRKRTVLAWPVDLDLTANDVAMQTPCRVKVEYVGVQWEETLP